MIRKKENSYNFLDCHEKRKVGELGNTWKIQTKMAEEDE